MKKYSILILANVLVIALCMHFWYRGEEKEDNLAYRFTLVCPQTWNDIAEGTGSADAELGTNTKCVGFKNMNEEEQIAAIKKAVYANVKGIITVGTRETPELTDAINLTIKKGIPVILVGSDLPESDRTCYIGTDNLKAGKIAGEDMAAAVNGKAKIGILVSELENSNQRERVEGFRNAVSIYKEMEIVEILECNADRIKIRKYLQQMLEENPDITALYCTEEIATDMVGEQLKSMGYAPGEIQVVSFGMTENVWNYISEGRYYSSIVQESFYQGVQAVTYLKDYLNGKNRETEVVYTDIESAKKDFDFEEWKSGRGSREVVWNLS